MDKMGRIACAFLCLAAATAPIAARATTIDPDNYNHSMTIRPAAGKVTSTLSNFPLLVRLSTERQPWFDPLDCGTNGADLRFALADGTLLAHEVDTWNPAGESVVWVNVPSLTAATEINAYWGVKDSSLAPAVNPADAWPDYVAVYHLGEGNATANDSSGNNYTAVNAKAVTAGVNPPVGGCANIQDLFVTTPAVTDLTASTAAKPLSDRSCVTFSAWVAIDSFNTADTTYAQNARVEIARKFSTNPRGKGGFACRYFADNAYSAYSHTPNPLFGLFEEYSGSGQATIWNTTAPQSNGNWLYLICTVNGTTAAKYVNGAAMSDSPKSMGQTILGPDTVTLDFGAADNSNNCQTHARMDEMRIRNGAVSAAWAAADYVQQSQDDFLEFEGEQAGFFVVSPIPDQIVMSYDDISGGVTPSVTVSNIDVGVELVLNADYAVAYSNNTAAGTAYAIVAGLNGYAAHTNRVAFQIRVIPNYYIVPGDNLEPQGTSSISGETGATGWSTTPGGARAVYGITVADAIYHVWTNRTIRSPHSKAYTTIQSSSIVIEPSCRWEIFDKMNGHTLTLNNLTIGVDAMLAFTPANDASVSGDTLAGNFTLEDGATLLVSASKEQDSARWQTLSASVTGRGAIFMPSKDSGYTYAGVLANQIAGDISAFTGDIGTWKGSSAVSLELVNPTSLPGNPAPGEVAYVVVTNAATLKVDSDWVSPTNRIWILGDAGTPTIEIPDGTTVEIDCNLVGSVGFNKTGAGTLVLKGESPDFSGEITIAAGTLRLGGKASTLGGRADVTITQAGGTLDITSLSIGAIPEQTVNSLEDLAAGIEPTLTVSDLDAGVQLVLGTDYTVSYLNNTTSGVATAVVTGINGYEGIVGSIDFIIHAVKLLTTSCNLTQDEDWTGFESISVYSAGVTLDLKGHKLTITGLDGAGRITDSVGGGELIFDVPAAYASGYAAKIDTVDLRGQLKLVKTGPGLLICSKAGQSYTGGTDILGGILRTADGSSGKTMDVFSPLGPNTSSAHNRVYLGPNGTLDPASTAGWAYHDLTIDGGMISNTVANTDLPGRARCFNPCLTVNADFTFATTEQYGWQIGELNGHTATVQVAPNKVLYLLSTATPPTSGRLNIVGGGTIGTLSGNPPNLSAIDFVDCNAALNLSGALSVHDYRPSCTANIGKGSVALSVYGTFTPATEYFYGPVMQNGSAIDLSAKTGVWYVTSSLTGGGNRTTTFAAGAKVKVELGGRKLSKGEKVIAWTTQPDATFTGKRWEFESRADGLYVLHSTMGTVFVVR